MDKTYKTELRRLFLLEDMPDPLTAASPHIQIFDNYIPETRIRIRSIRDPKTRKWTRTLQRRIEIAENDLAVVKIAEFELNEKEYEAFRVLEEAEIRKNRYYHEFENRVVSIDVYLGKLRGLNIAHVTFQEADDSWIYAPPGLLLLEITNEPFFEGQNLVSKDFAEVRTELPNIALPNCMR